MSVNCCWLFEKIPFPLGPAGVDGRGGDNEKSWGSGSAPGGTALAPNCPGTCSTIVGLWPEVTGNFKRFDATMRYKFDETFVKQLGWVGDVYFKVKYAYETNFVNNWALGNMVRITEILTDGAKPSKKAAPKRAKKPKKDEKAEGEGAAASA